MTTGQLMLVPSLRHADRGELVAQQTQIGWIAALHALAANEISQTFIWTAYQGIEQLESLEQQVRAAELAGELSPQTAAKFHRRVDRHRARLASLADQAGAAIVTILSS